MQPVVSQCTSARSAARLMCRFPYRSSKGVRRARRCIKRWLTHSRAAGCRGPAGEPGYSRANLFRWSGSASSSCAACRERAHGANSGQSADAPVMKGCWRSPKFAECRTSLKPRGTGKAPWNVRGAKMIRSPGFVTRGTQPSTSKDGSATTATTTSTAFRP
jgi:hypothetical protein